MELPLTSRSDLEYIAAPLAGTRPRVPWLVLFALGLALPTLRDGFLTDDHRFRALLAEPGSSWVPELFDFASGDATQNLASIARGRLPWWTAPDFRLHLWRPLTGALFALEYRAFGGHAWGYHLCSLALLATLLLLAQRLYRAILPAGAAAWALALFALRVHPDAYGWIAAQHVLLGACCVASALVARVAGRRPWLVTSRLALGLLASESAVCGLAFLLAFELRQTLAAQPDAAQRVSATARRFLAASWRTWLLAAVYFTGYHAGQWGSRGSGFYRDPVAAPVAFLRVAPARLLVLLADLLLGVPAELGVSTQHALAAAAGLAACALAAAALWLNRSRLLERERAALGWLAPAALLGLCVACAGVPGGRVLTLPSLGFAALGGALLRASFAQSRGRARGFAIVFAVVQCGIGPLISLATQRQMEHRAREGERIGRAFIAELGARRTAFVFASDPIVFASQYAVSFDEARGFDACVSVASAARSAHRLTRTGPRSVLFETLGSPLLDGSFDSMVRDETRPFSAGSRAHQCQAEFVVTRAFGGKPRAVSLELTTDPDDHELAFFRWNGNSLMRFALPELGQSLELPWFPGPSLIY